MTFVRDLAEIADVSPACTNTGIDPNEAWLEQLEQLERSAANKKDGFGIIDSRVNSNPFPNGKESKLPVPNSIPSKGWKKGFFEKSDRRKNSIVKEHEDVAVNSPMNAVPNPVKDKCEHTPSDCKVGKVVQFDVSTPDKSCKDVGIDHTTISKDSARSQLKSKTVSRPPAFNGSIVEKFP